MQKRLSNDSAGLKFVHAFGWLRAAELGALLFPKTANATIAAARIIRSWEQRRFVIVRELPERSGRAVVLAAGGVRFLAENGHQANSGKDLGSTTGGEWKPPASWRHDLIAAGVLAELRKRGYGVIPEAELRRRAKDCPKLPDGLLRSPQGQWIWLEVEHARKSGKNLQDLGKALALACAGEIKAIAGVSCTAALVAYCDSRDERGYAVNHKERVIKAVSEHCKKPIELLTARCSVIGVGVSGLALEKTLVEPQKAVAVLRVLNAEKWLQLGNEIQQAHYGSHIASVWPIEPGLWGYQVDDLSADYASSISEAKHSCARAIANLL